MLFDVRITAFDPQAAVDPVEALMRLFKIERAFAREVVHRLPRVIKRGVPLETAQRLSQVLERIGARVEVLVSERAQV
ncbi:MAG TPA: ribosomal protein L7/L12, partial [Polyangiales bacterium]